MSMILTIKDATIVCTLSYIHSLALVKISNMCIIISIIYCISLAQFIVSTDDLIEKGNFKVSESCHL